MKRSETSPSRLDVWGDSLLNKLPSRTRQKRKREASKKRRVQVQKALSNGQQYNASK